MHQEFQKIQKEFEEMIAKVQTVLDLETLEQDFFSRKSGKFTMLAKQIKDVVESERKAFGEGMNRLKEELQNFLQVKREEFGRSVSGSLASAEAIDVTLPQIGGQTAGTLHPITQLQNDIEDFFSSMGFMVLDGPELESEYFNFESMNVPADHPARDMQDTFYIKDRPGQLMRTHTSSAQVRALLRYGAPLRAIVPGKCFRNESTDVRHEHTFYQIDGLVVDKGISFAHMKGVIEALAKHLYGDKTRVRLRPKFYPFVEPGVNGEVTCYLCHGKGCRLCKNTGWLEIFGAGLVHAHVLKEGGVDPNEYQGFAFGLGLNRLVMLKYGIEDIRLFESGDLRFLKQFSYARQ